MITAALSAFGKTKEKQRRTKPGILQGTAWRRFLRNSLKYSDKINKALYNQSREDEKEAKEILIEFEEQYPNTLKTENIDSVLEQMKRRRDKTV